MIFELIGEFQDNATKVNLEKKKEKKRKLQENNGIHWTNPNMVAKKQCIVCGHGSSTVFECFQCNVNIHPTCMAEYHKWI